MLLTYLLPFLRPKDEGFKRKMWRETHAPKIVFSHQTRSQGPFPGLEQGKALGTRLFSHPSIKWTPAWIPNIFSTFTVKSTWVQRTPLLSGLGQQYIWVIDQVWSQDGWILAKFFFACLWTETESRSIKKNEANIQQSWPNKLGQ